MLGTRQPRRRYAAPPHTRSGRSLPVRLLQRVTARRQSSPRPVRAGRPAPARASAELPTWSDLAGTSNERTSGGRSGGRLAGLSTARFALLVLLLAAGTTLYVGHVHATQDVLAQVQEARRQNLRLHLKHNRLRGAFDRATSPAVVLGRARALGLRPGIAYGPAVTITD